MKRLLGVLVVFACLSAQSYGQGPASNEPANAGGDYPKRVTECRVADVGTALQPWRECRSPATSSLAFELCGAQSDQTALAAFRRTRDRLAAKVMDLDELCRLDTDLVLAQDMCRFTSKPGGADDVSSLMDSVARNWEFHGKLERADQLYRRAFELYGATGWPVAQFGVLHSLSVMRMEADDFTGAIALAQQRTAMARERYENPDYANVASGDPRVPAAHDLIQSLQTEAVIFEHAGLGDAAQVAKRQADALQANQPPCKDGTCWEVIGKTTGRASNPCEVPLRQLP